MTIRDRVKSIAIEVRDQDVPPSRARELLMDLSGLFANVTMEVTEAEIEYAGILNECYQSEEASNRAEIKAKATPQYRRKLEAKATHTIVSKMMGSLRSVLNSLDTEMRLSGR